jgi:hypothetical protein
MSDAASIITAGRTERQHAIAAIIAETLIANGIDYGRSPDGPQCPCWTAF